MRKIFLSSAVFVLTIFSNAQPDAKLMKKLDSIFSSFNKTTPGAAVTVLQNGKVLVKRSYGFASLEHKVPLKHNSVVRLAYSEGREFMNIFGPLDTEDGFKARLSISAYHQIVENKKAPAMLIINGGTYYFVKLHNVARYVARLQNPQLSECPVLFMVDWKGGHAKAGTSRADIIRKWKFLLGQTGHSDFQSKKK